MLYTASINTPYSIILMSLPGFSNGGVCMC